MDSSIIYRFFFVFLIFISPAKAIEFKGKFLQGHFILGKTDPKAKILVGKKEVKVSKDGFFVFGIDRDQKYDLTFTKIIDGKKSITTKKVLKRKYNIQRIDGLAESKVTPPESVYKRIREFIITNSGPEIRDSFSNFEQIFSGAPHRVVPDQNVQNVFKGLDKN